ncbi:LOW QUALITY PROTEIN: probable multidrug resistance-associated protein lethal(2)03659 [Leptinotarsa decemlineata]|uniref:LOW QUALITY PROTEIN: probable multidrug resistance-associated protein lethal(2)03659 n=1 Tax=Leptinotarsa decemlineata TaxID=7539 RepID=UPI003D3086BB
MEEEKLIDGKPLKKNPVDRSNIISEICFCWLLPYFRKGYKRELTEDDMYQHRRKHDSGKLGDRMEAAWDRQVAKNDNPSLMKALCSVFLLELVLLGTILVVSEIIRMSQPLLISRLLTIFDTNQVDADRSDAYQCAVMIVVSALLNVLCIHNFNFRIMQVGMKMRVALCSLIYRKAMRLSTSALAETTIGQMVNLLTNDVGRFDQATHFIHHLWMAPTELFVVMYLCYNNVGYTGLTGILFLLLSIPLQTLLGNRISKFRLTIAYRTDERVRLMNEIISGIQVIKMYTWEKPFSKLVETVRKREMKYIKLASTIRAIMSSFSISLNRTAVFTCIITYVLTGNTLNSAYAFTVTSYYRLLNGLSMFFPQAVSQVSEMLISIKRIRSFLLYEEIERNTTDDGNKNPSGKNAKPSPRTNPTGKDSGIHLNRVSVRWLKSNPDNNLHNVTMNIESGQLVAVVGSVGSGKNDFLHVILEELEPQSGSVEINGRISYASQEPWLFGGSVRQNILFGQKFDQQKYDEVVRVCALKRDFTLFPHGDRTLAGERGVSLSGGQRARINLARAIYKDADIYLLDDPLSAVDTHVAKQLFEDCICGYLAKKCVVLVTHQLQFLKHVPSIYLLEKGKVLVSGSYEDIRNSNSSFTKLLHDIEEEEEEHRRKSRMTLAKVEAVENEVQVLEKEATAKGSISWHVYKSYMKAGGNILKAATVLLIFVMSQAVDSFSDYFITFWVNVQQATSRKLLQSTVPNVTLAVTQSTVLANSTSSLKSTELFQATGNTITESAMKVTAMASLLTSNVTPTGNFSSAEYPFEEWWLTPLFTGPSTPIYYSMLVVCSISLTYLGSLSFYRWCLTASTRMHNRMFNNIVHSPMRFFNINPCGRVLNRFSKDIGTLDESLPATMLDTIQIGLCVAAISTVIGSLSIWILVPTVIVFAVFYLIRVVFLQTSRDVKRVESITRSPIFTHLAASLQGLTTIRAFKAEEILKNEFDNYQNHNSAAFFMFLGANRTFGFLLDFICVIYIAAVLATLLLVKGETFGGNIGLALTQAMGLMGMFQYGMRQWSELENQMTSVERVQEYADLKHEAENMVRPTPKNWPEAGDIEFRNLNLRYSPTDPYVLKNLSFSIKAKEKVGIVGRTGAGKSSLIQALFRLADIDGEGGIFIDNIDTKSISLHKLRSSISIIPQEPVLFSGTLRKNLDPFDEYEDEILWSALEEVELKKAVDDLPSGLDSKMAEGGSNFSVGQRQLVCLARAILRRNKVLVLDEATANVDPHTDALIQSTIRKRFADCTVLTIAHRLHTIMDSDKVLVMDAGQAAEFGHPHLLLKNEGGVFYSLVLQTGKAHAKNLIAVAEEKFNRDHQEDGET